MPAFRGIRSVLVFVPDPAAAAQYWAAILGHHEVVRMPSLAMLTVGDIELVFRLPDERNQPGGSPVIYWWVDDFAQSRRELGEWGSYELHYPLETPGGTMITQFRDPFGMIFGIEGPRISTVERLGR